MQNFLILISLVFTLTSCQLRQTHPADKNAPVIVSAPIEQNKVNPTPVDPVVISPNVLNPQTNVKPEQFGLVFSGGGVKTWAYVNVLKEIQKYKLPVTAVAGAEWGAVVAGIYAENISANEVEWELSKFKSIEEWSSYVQKVFEKKSTSNLKIPFGCSSLNLKNQTSYVLNKGQLSSLVPFCVPAPGVINPYSDSIASMTDISSLVQFLKANGATKVIIVNALASKNSKPHSSALGSIENQFWIQAASELVKKNTGADEIIDVDVPSVSVEKFEQRRDVLNNSIPTAKDQIKKIANKYGF